MNSNFYSLASTIMTTIIEESCSVKHYKNRKIIISVLINKRTAMISYLG
jgi:hypothetical protein